MAAMHEKHMYFDESWGKANIFQSFCYKQFIVPSPHERRNLKLKLFGYLSFTKILDKQILSTSCLYYPYFPKFWTIWSCFPYWLQKKLSIPKINSPPQKHCKLVSKSIDIPINWVGEEDAVLDILHAWRSKIRIHRKGTFFLKKMKFNLLTI